MSDIKFSWLDENSVKQSELRKKKYWKVAGLWWLCGIICYLLTGAIK